MKSRLDKLNVTSPASYPEYVGQMCKALSDKFATDIKIITITGMTDIADYFIIASAKSAAQCKAAFEHLEATMEKNDMFAIRKEGITEGRWIAVDYGEVIVHIFHQETREIYGLDTLWNNGANVQAYVEE